ncbi:hypothetical protein AAH476_24795, partial [Enterobacter cloacae subsp. cloacae]
RDTDEQTVLDHFWTQGEPLNVEDIARLSAYCHRYVNKFGHYSFTLEELVTRGHLRSLKETSEEVNIA